LTRPQRQLERPRWGLGLDRSRTPSRRCGPRRLCQGRRIVHAIADHRDGPATSLEALDRIGLVGRQDLGGHLVDADAPGHRIGDRLGVAGDHGDPNSERVEALHRLG